MCVARMLPLLLLTLISLLFCSDLNLGDFSYGFLIDGKGRAMSHPLLPKPAEYTAPPVFVDISQLEPAAEFATVKASMLARAAGSKAMTMTRSFPRGSGDTSSGAAPRNADGDGVAFVSKAVRFRHTRSVRVFPPHALPLVLAAHQTLSVYKYLHVRLPCALFVLKYAILPCVTRRNASEVFQPKP